jgi:CheY-like chemotaxis protein/signal transduction histidine kinase/HAMP domain-containing protein
VDVKGEILELKNTINVMVDQLNSFASEVTRVAREVGTEGELGGQAEVPGVAGTWKDLTDNVNVMAANLTSQVRNIAEVTTAIARGDLSRKITVDVKGEILELKNTINTVVDQLNSFASEVTRVAREVGTDGRLGGQAEVEGVSGTWKDLTDNVNVMAANLTSQVRAIVKVVTAVANGDLAQKLTFDAKGEVAALADTINGMTDTLATFAAQVTTVAREVGVEGRLGGQANVPGAAGTWQDLTANVNLLAANLTTQVRAIANVATAVTKGDLTRSIQVDAKGEVADLKNYINAMIGNLRETTDRNTQQDWLKTNLAKFSRMLQGQRDLTTVAQGLLSELAPLVEAQQGVLYVVAETDYGRRLRQVAGYADYARSGPPREYAFNEGLIGQCAYERRRLVLEDLPPRTIRISTGLMELEPRTVIVLPVLFEGQVKAVIELASLREFTAQHIAFLEQLADIVGVVLNNIEVTMRTELLLEQTQQLAMEQQTQGRELQKTNEELAQKARLLAAQNAEVERKNTEIEQARRAVEEKAAELALTSRYKSEFLANMSHELRTPLNSILVLGQQLADNVDSNLSARQVEFATTIHGAGTDLLNLINDILDLAKIESGTVTLQCEDLSFADLSDAVQRTFRHETEAGELEFAVEFDTALPPTIRTDAKRLLQVLKNLLSNAFKFTERGAVALRVRPAASGWTPGQAVLDTAAPVIAFSVSDTGIGIALDKQKIVFESFQQADAGTARKHGGTGLGLSISRDLAQLLGGEIRLDSISGKGSTFTLYLPATYAGATVLPEIEVRGDTHAHGHVHARAVTLTAGAPPAPRPPAVPDDRADIGIADRSMLIVEDDIDYAKILLDIARKRGFKGIVATRGAEALALVRKQRPSAVCLDIGLPDMLGWAVLGQLKQDPLTRHVPVQVLTGDDDPVPALARGAFAYLTKPVTAQVLGDAFDRVGGFLATPKRGLLVVEPNPGETQSLSLLVEHDDIELVTAANGAEALTLLRERPFDCVVVERQLPDMSAFELVERSSAERKHAGAPFVIHATAELDDDSRRRFGSLGKTNVLTLADSAERLLDEASMFLHRDITKLPDAKLQMLLSLQQGNKLLAGKKILVVDDDVRNIFALSSVLERYGMHVVAAHTGLDAIRLLEEMPDISLVLLDIMMPEMDGYETMRRIRMRPEFQLLPIITLTAKAMKGDREKCLEAGASDYIAKPVDSEHLLSLLRVWLRR